MLTLNQADRAFICSIAAAAAYENEQGVALMLNGQQNLCTFTTVSLHSDAVTDSHGFLAINDDIVLLAFCGTKISQWQNIFTDLQTHLVESINYPGKVHYGFETAVKSLMQQPHTDNTTDAPAPLHPPLLQTLTEVLQGTGRQLWITGHSLGGALATLAAVLCEQNSLSVDTICTFGAPMVGDVDFAAAYDTLFLNRHERFVNHDDVIPLMPSSQFYLLSATSLLLGEAEGSYRQVGTLRYINQAGEVIANSSLDTRISDHHLPIPLDARASHRKTLYIKAMSNYRTQMAQLPNRGTSIGMAFSSAVIPLKPSSEVDSFSDLNDLNSQLLKPKKPASNGSCIIL